MFNYDSFAMKYAKSYKFSKKFEKKPYCLLVRSGRENLRYFLHKPESQITYSYNSLFVQN